MKTYIFILSICLLINTINAEDLVYNNPVLINNFGNKSNLLIDSILVYPLDMTGRNDKNIYEYDTNDNLIHWAFLYWEKDHWQKWMDHYYQYDEKSQIISELWERWGYNDSMLLRTRYSYTYDDTEKKSSCLIESWKDSFWINDEWWYYYYNEKDFIIKDSLKGWQKDHWGKLGQYSEYFYDNYNNLLQRNMSKHREIFEYDNNNNRISFLTQDLSDSVWKNSDLWEYNYDDSNRLITEALLVWNIQMSEWDNHIKHLYLYDKANRKTEKIVQIPIPHSGEWENYVKIIYEYNDDGLPQFEYMFDWVDGDWQPGTTKGFTFDLECFADYFEATSGNKLEVFYNPKTDVHDNSKKEKITISVSPNPSSNQIKIRINDDLNRFPNGKVEISNNIGEKLLNIPTDEVIYSQGIDLDVSAFPSGMYFCTVRTGSFVETQPFLVIH